jgi:orotate phosphoribosyltransferase
MRTQDKTSQGIKGLYVTAVSHSSLSSLFCPSIRFYAMAIRESGVQFDVIFGPAYKGIPLATTLAMAWCQLYGENKEICYNRKEVKDHGEVVPMQCLSTALSVVGLLLLMSHSLLLLI